MSNSPFNPRVVATGVQGVPKSTGGKMAVCDVPVKYSMPCSVILVHGVNDVGEAYQNQEQGIIAGLNERMGRTDMYPHEWQQYTLDMGDREQQKVTMPGRSPVLPFYWGYKPDDHATYIEDQRRYR
ncbi:alpha/beta hydrolase, partial [Raoultella ornithinolytica]